MCRNLEQNTNIYIILPEFILSLDKQDSPLNGRFTFLYLKKQIVR